MIFDLLAVAVLTAFLTVLTATKKDIFSHLKQNAITSGILFTVVQLMIFVTKLDSADSEASDLYGLTISMLVRFRPLLAGVLFKIVFSIVEKIFLKSSVKNQDGGDKTDAKGNVSSSASKSSERATLDFSVLSHREIEVARLASKGYTNSQIAEELFISTETVKSHMNGIFEKLGITSRKELMYNAMEESHAEK